MPSTGREGCAARSKCLNITEIRPEGKLQTTVWGWAFEKRGEESVRVRNAGLATGGKEAISLKIVLFRGGNGGGTCEKIEIVHL